MGHWSWVGRKLRWDEMLICALAFDAWMEGPLYYSDLVRGIAVGLALSALVSMIAGRYVLNTLAFAGIVALSFLMAPKPAPSLVYVICTHTLAAFMLLVPISNGIHALWQRRGHGPLGAH